MARTARFQSACLATMEALECRQLLTAVVSTPLSTPPATTPAPGSTFFLANEMSGITPNTSGDLVLNQLPDQLDSGTAQAGGANTITLAANDASTTSIVGDRIEITGGTAAGEAGLITKYDPATKIATVTSGDANAGGSANWATAPDSASTYQILNTNYLGTFEALKGGINVLTNGTTQTIALGQPDGGTADATDPTNAAFDTGRTSTWQATYTLGAANPNPNGYDIGEIDSITGHKDTRTDQTIDVQVQFAGADTNFYSLSGGKDFSYRPGLGQGAAQMAIVNDSGGNIVSNVKAVRFVAVDPGAVYRELVVSGAPSASAPATTPPAAPTALTATASGQHVTLNWTPAASDGALGYVVDRSADGTNFTTLGAVTGTTYTYNDAAPAPSTTFYYRVRAVNAAGESANSPVAAATTGAFGAEEHVFNAQFWQGAPAASDTVNNIDFNWGNNKPDPAVTNAGSFSVLFTGKVHSDNAGTYTFISNTDDDGYLFVDGQLVSADPGGHGQRDASSTRAGNVLTPISLAANSDYDFAFYMNQRGGGSGAHMEWIEPDASGNAMAKVMVPADHLKSASDVPPASVLGDVAGPNGVALYWTSPSVASTLQYEIERAPVDSSGNVGTYTLLATLPAINLATPQQYGATGYGDDTVNPGATYAYEVVAQNFDGSTTSLPLKVTTPTSGNNPGAEAHYYGQGYWAGSPLVSTRVDTVDFNWSGGTPDPSIQNQNNSSVFTGKITAPQSGQYTFVSNTDDDGFLWVNGTLVSMDYGTHGQENASNATLKQEHGVFPISLTAGQSYDFVFMENQGSGGSGAHLEWVTPAMAAAGQTTPFVIPEQYLTAQTDQPTAPTSFALASGMMDGSGNTIANPSPHGVWFNYADDNNGVVAYLLQRRPSGSSDAWQTISRSDPGVTRIEDASPVPGTSYDYRLVPWNYDVTNLDAIASPVVTVSVPSQATYSDPTTEPPGAEGHFYNGNIASATFGQDPRNFAVGNSPVESQALSGPIDFNYNGAPGTMPGGTMVGDSPDATQSLDQNSLLFGPDFVHRESFAGVWTGKIITDQAGTYTFLSNTDDDGYLYVNGQLASSDPYIHGARTAPNVTPISLASNTAYDFVFIQQQLTGGSAAHLDWIEPGQTTAVAIPAYTPANATAGTPAAGGLVQISDVPTGPVDPTNNPNGSAAADVHVGDVSSSGVLVGWQDVSNSELWFEIQRSTDGGSTWTTVGRSGFDTGTFLDSTATDSTTTYSYRVRGVNFDGAGPWSSVAGSNSLVLPAPLITGSAVDANSVTLGLSDASSKVTSYDIYDSTDGQNFSKIATANMSGGSYTVSNLTAGQQYWFYAVAVDGGTAASSAPSNIVSATPSATGPETVNFPDFSNAAGSFQLNGANTTSGSVGATITSPTATPPNALELTPDKGNQTNSAFTTTPEHVDSFATTFTFQFQAADGKDPAADGFTFTLQNSAAGDKALGGGGGSLGAAGIAKSVSIKFDLYPGESETGVSIDGTGFPDTPSQSATSTALTPTYLFPSVIDLTKTSSGAATGINFHKNPTDKYQVYLGYDGKTLTETITDISQLNEPSVTQTYTIDIPSIVGSQGAYIGFTGATGGSSAQQDVLSWTYGAYAPQVPPPPPQINVINDTTGGRTITIKQDKDGQHIDWSMGSEAGQMAMSDAKGLTINDSGAQDTIVLDSSNGSALPNLLKLSGNFVVNGLSSLGTGQKLDIGSSNVQINYTGATLLPTLQGYLKSGQIFSSNSSNTMAVADVDNGSAVNLSLRLIGDANGDGQVGFADLVALARNYGKSGADWSMGDFTYDGQVGFADLVALARNYGAKTGTTTTAALQPTLSTASVLSTFSSLVAKSRRPLSKRM